MKEDLLVTLSQVFTYIVDKVTLTMLLHESWMSKNYPNEELTTNTQSDTSNMNLCH